MDTLEAESVSPERLNELVPEDFSEHWARTLEFLRIVTQFWPAHLAEQRLASPVEHRKRLLRAEVARLKAHPPKAPVIVAGVTSADPAALELIKAVLGLENGALVLPALDQSLDADSWDTIAPGHAEHPQFGMAELLGSSASRATRCRAAGHQRCCGAGGAYLADQRSGCGRPAAALAPLRRGRQQARYAGRLVWPVHPGGSNGEDEAEAIALILRKAVETPGKTAALVSPDPALGRRVAARLAAWRIDVVPSAGSAFAKTEIGAFLDLTAEAAAREFEPVAAMSLLKHRLCRPGMSATDVRAAPARSS